ncbi:hypothetical protein JCM10212_000939 [Sporobolomyces blumeae]
MSPSPASSSSTTPDAVDEVYDLLGIGYGPASVAIAIALSEYNSNAPSPQASSPVRAPDFSSLGGLQQALGYDRTGSPSRDTQQDRTKTSGPRRRAIKAAFIERHDGFKWHPGMMLEGSRMQISFLKDLATLRNPQSAYTFLSYLSSFTPSRLVSFISLGTFTPTRREFSDYLQWCAEKAGREIEQAGGSLGFGEDVVAVEALRPGVEDGYKLLKVTSRVIATGELKHRLTRNLVVSAGGSAKIPSQLQLPDIRSSNRVLHTSVFLDNIDSSLSSALSASRPDRTRPIRLAVIGGGQSATECFLQLRNKLAAVLPLLEAQGQLEQRPQVDLLIRRAALRPTDEGAFSNEVFDPAMSHAMYGLNDEKRKVVLDEAKSTNYSIVNPVTLAAVYEAMYAQKVEEDVLARTAGDASSLLLDPKLNILPYTTLVSASVSPSGAIDLELRNTIREENRNVAYDLIVCGTGYDRQAYRNILFPASTAETEDSDAVPLAKLFASASRPGSASAPSIPPLPLDVRLPESAFTRRESHESLASAYPSSRSASTARSTTSSNGDSDSIRTPPSDAVSTAPSSPPSLASDPAVLKDVPTSTSDELPNFVVGDNYRLQVPTSVTEADGKVRNFKPTIWLQGSCEKSHGISDSLLSVLAVRSGEVVTAMLNEAYFGDARD